MQRPDSFKLPSNGRPGARPEKRPDLDAADAGNQVGGAGNVLIVGTGGAIARALAVRFSAAGHNVVLAGRDIEDLGVVAADLGIRFGVRAAIVAFEALDFAGIGGAFDDCASQLDGGLAGVVICHGLLPDQAAAQVDWELARRTIDVNFTSVALLLNAAARYFEPRGSGFLCVLSSVAGDRGRQSNYVYGAAKGGLNIYLQGLRQRLSKRGIAVVTVKPGFTDTDMTWGLAGMFLVAPPEKVADDIYQAIRKNRGSIYTPWFWRIIMAIIKSIPAAIFNRIKL
jgi:short-subunit dehydrogenase